MEWGDREKLGEGFVTRWHGRNDGNLQSIAGTVIVARANDDRARQPIDAGHWRRYVGGLAGPSYDRPTTSTSWGLELDGCDMVAPSCVKPTVHLAKQTKIAH